MVGTQYMSYNWFLQRTEKMQQSVGAIPRKFSHHGEFSAIFITTGDISITGWKNNPTAIPVSSKSPNYGPITIFNYTKH